MARVGHGCQDADAQQNHGADDDVQLRYASHRCALGETADDDQETDHVEQEGHVVSP